jgi:hypothetical protein
VQKHRILYQFSGEKVEELKKLVQLVHGVWHADV